jgi:hypothetical protein
MLRSLCRAPSRSAANRTTARPAGPVERSHRPRRAPRPTSFRRRELFSRTASTRRTSEDHRLGPTAWRALPRTCPIQLPSAGIGSARACPCCLRAGTCFHSGVVVGGQSAHLGAQWGGSDHEWRGHWHWRASSETRVPHVPVFPVLYRAQECIVMWMYICNVDGGL